MWTVRVNGVDATLSRSCSTVRESDARILLSSLLMEASLNLGGPGIYRGDLGRVEVPAGADLSSAWEAVALGPAGVSWRPLREMAEA